MRADGPAPPERAACTTLDSRTTPCLEMRDGGGSTGPFFCRRASRERKVCAPSPNTVRCVEHYRLLCRQVRRSRPEWGKGTETAGEGMQGVVWFGQATVEGEVFLVGHEGWGQRPDTAAILW